jgi:hypothetical protein
MTRRKVGAQVSPGRDTGAALVLPFANAEMMNLYPVEISVNVASGAHAVLTVDGAGWHKTGDKLHVPGKITLLHLPPYSPRTQSGAKCLGLFGAAASSATACRRLRCHHRNMLRCLAVAHLSTSPINLHRKSVIDVLQSMTPSE